MPHGRQTPLESATFTSCSFTNLVSTNNGGAISCTKSGATICISHSEFYNCEGFAGGAIYVSSLSFLTILSTSFILCRTTSTTEVGGGGGGVELESVDIPLISECQFLHCSAKDDGGGIRTLNCGYEDTSLTPLSQPLIVQICYFVDCHCKDGDSHSGAAIIFWKDRGTLGCSNCLFYKLSAVHSGGAIYTWLYEKPSNKIVFSFFHDNSCDRGFDVCIAYKSSTIRQGTEISPFVHSFTLTSTVTPISPRSVAIVHYYYWDYYYDAKTENWFPQANIYVS